MEIGLTSVHHGLHFAAPALGGKRKKTQKTYNSCSANYYRVFVIDRFFIYKHPKNAAQRGNEKKYFRESACFSLNIFKQIFPKVVDTNQPPSSAGGHDSRESCPQEISAGSAKHS